MLSTLLRSAITKQSLRTPMPQKSRTRKWTRSELFVNKLRMPTRFSCHSWASCNTIQIIPLTCRRNLTISTAICNLCSTASTRNSPSPREPIYITPALKALLRRKNNWCVLAERMRQVRWPVELAALYSDATLLTCDEPSRRTSNTCRKKFMR